MAGSTNCTDPDGTYSNAIKYALFGEKYTAPTTDDVHVRKAIPVAYCHRVDTGTYEMGNNVNDFAYCVLTEAPNVQPIPPMMHCEVDQFLPNGTPVTAIGFGESSGAGTHGTKRSATSTLTLTYNAMATQITALGAWSPGVPSNGDSGGPLFVRLPDLSWRIIGVAAVSAGYNAVWPRMAWIAMDPNVDMSVVLPCHTPAGAWSPGPNCTGFPRDPNITAGKWARAPRACYHSNVGGPSTTCGSHLVPGDVASDLAARTPDGESPDASAGGHDSGSECTARIGTKAHGDGILLLGVGLLFGHRRRGGRR